MLTSTFEHVVHEVFNRNGGFHLFFFTLLKTVKFLKELIGIERLLAN